MARKQRALTEEVIKKVLQDLSDQSYEGSANALSEMGKSVHFILRRV